MSLTRICQLIIWTCLFVHSAQSQSKDPFPYDLKNPDNIYFMPIALEEISGLTYYAKNQLAALNDEHGRVYVYDIVQKKVVHRIRFEGNGDFEGLELVGKNMYAIKSNGKMYRFNIDIEGVVETIETPFSSENNVEGLGYDPLNHRLLIALKDEGDVAQVKVKGKAAYTYDLKTEKFSKTPHLILKDDDLERVLGANSKKLRPSGIAVHPINGDIYMVAAVGRALVVFDNSGKPKNLSILKRSIFPQPEGITFSPEGELFISNEQEGEGGTIVRFKMK